MSAIQLTLFPARGFGILALGELLHDYRTGDPYVAPSRQAAQRMLKHNAPTWIPDARVVSVEVHEGDEIPTYIIGS